MSIYDQPQCPSSFDPVSTRRLDLDVQSPRRRLRSVVERIPLPPLMHARGHCLIDHLAVLVDELREPTGLEVLLDVAPHALELLDRA
jgi:hypothetical protein